MLRADIDPSLAPLRDRRAAPERDDEIHRTPMRCRTSRIHLSLTGRGSGASPILKMRANCRSDMRSVPVIFPLPHHAALLALLAGRLRGAGGHAGALAGRECRDSGQLLQSCSGRSQDGFRRAYDPGAVYGVAREPCPWEPSCGLPACPTAPSVEVRVNDRCACTHGRQLDLSEAAARQLNMLGRLGTVKVRIEILDRRPAR